MKHKVYYHRRVICEIEIDDHSVLGLLMRGKFAPAWAELTRRMEERIEAEREAVMYEEQREKEAQREAIEYEREYDE